MFYNFVRNNVHGGTIFGSAIALETDVLGSTGRVKFCPYAHKKEDGSAHAFDLALSYDYTTNDTEWYAEVRAKKFSDVRVINDSVAINE